MNAKAFAVGAVAIVALAAAVGAAWAGRSGAQLEPGTSFYVPGFEQDAKQQWAKLVSRGDRANADLLAAMENTSHAVWITGGSPNDARVDAMTTVHKAEAKRQLPVFALYDLPFRDCAQYSAGGALNTDEYEAWIDGVAGGIGGHPAIVILEPDGIGLVPGEGCTVSPDDLAAAGLASQEEANAARYEQLNYAVDMLGANPNAKVYLDATHPAWLGVGDIAARLVKAGVERSAGFFLNVSNYQYTVNSVYYGTWISQCIAQGDYAGCANQYWNGGPEGTKIADLLGPWTGVALSPYGEWSVDADDPALNVSGYASRFWGTPTTHFVVDTSRNGQGPWAGPLDWCNPPGRGLGLRPTADTGNPLVDAYLWVKVPGQSDGQCTRGDTTDGTDSAWGLVDPAAGAWFPQQALQLAQLAQPPLAP